MPVHSDYLCIDDLIRRGAFGEGLLSVDRSAHELRAVDPLAFAAVRAELLEHTGDSIGAWTVAEAALPQATDSQAIQSRLLHVLGVVAFDRGDYQESFGFLQRSIRAADTCANATLGAKTRLTLLSRFFDSANSVLNASALLPEVRRAIARSGDPHLVIGLRLTFAKVEASRDSRAEARRHLLAAEELLGQYPNLWLLGRVELGLSVLANMVGIPEEAAVHARRAIELAEQSGHSRTRLVGLVNLSHALHASGKFSEARKCAATVLSRAMSDVELQLTALDTLANVNISEGALDDARQRLAEMDRLLQSEGLRFALGGWSSMPYRPRSVCYTLSERGRQAKRCLWVSWRVRRERPSMHGVFRFEPPASEA